jgi:hypothetical protein
MMRPGTAGVWVCRPVRRTGACSAREGEKGIEDALPSKRSTRNLAAKETAFWTRKRESRLKRRDLDMILFSQQVGVKENRVNSFVYKKSWETRATSESREGYRKIPSERRNLCHPSFVVT